MNGYDIVELNIVPVATEGLNFTGHSGPRKSHEFPMKRPDMEAHKNKRKQPTIKNLGLKWNNGNKCQCNSTNKDKEIVINLGPAV